MIYQREDDKETVENRIQINIEQSKPILNYYNAKYYVMLMEKAALTISLQTINQLYEPR